MKQRLAVLYTIVFTIISLKFFDANFIDDKIILYLGFLTMTATAIIALPFTFPKGGGFVLGVQLIVIGIVISMFMAYLSWGQSIRDTLLETLPMLVWIFFFLLLAFRIPIRTIEHITLAFGLMYIVLYFFQLAQSPTVLFGQSLWGDTFTTNRGIVRIMFPGAGVFVLSVFIAANRLTSESKHRLLMGFIVLMGLVIPVLQVTRMFIVGIAMMLVFHFVKDQDFIKRYLFAAGCVIVVIALLFSDLPVIQGMLESGTKDLGQGSDYIRVKAGDYFLYDLSPNWVSKIFGNGAPNWGFSDYGLTVEYLGTTHGYFLSDVGIIAVYAMFGVIAVIGFVLIWIKSFTIPVPAEYFYVKYYLWYLLFNSLTSSHVYYHHYLIGTVFALYIYQTIHLRTSRLVDQFGVERKYYLPETAPEFDHPNPILQS